MLIFGTVSIGAADLSRAAAFWCTAIGLEQRSGDDHDGVRVLTTDGRPVLTIRPRTPGTEPPPTPATCLELYARDEQDQTAEIERLVALGARRMDAAPDGYDHQRSLLLDTEGNPFAIVSNIYAPRDTQIGLAAT